jgi:predicted dehydrogenase
MTPRFAVIGTGAMAHAMMRAFQFLRMPVTAIASEDPERARAFAKKHGIPISKSDLASVLARDDVDAVYIANSANNHALTATAALSAGKAVLCEKPLALSLDEAVNVAAVARRTKTLLMEGLWTFFLPAYRRFFELSRLEALGSPIGLTASFGYPANEIERTRLAALDRGGVLFDRGIYLVALSLRTLGPARHVTFEIGPDTAGASQDTFLQIAHVGGAVSQLATSIDGVLSNTATLFFRRGSVALEAPLIGSEHVSMQLAQPKPPPPNPARSPSAVQLLKAKLRENPQLRRLKRRLTKSTVHYAPFGPLQYVHQLTHFAGLLAAEQFESDIIPLNFSIEIQHVLALAHQNRTASEEVLP